MSFNDNITLSTEGVSRGSGKRGAAIGGGIGGLGLLGALIMFLLTGQIPNFGSANVAPDNGGVAAGDETSLAEECRSGADANASDECRMVAGKNSLDAFWGKALPAEAGISYISPGLVLYSGMVNTACGTGSSQTGPFICPGDDKIYIDVSFFNQLTRMGAENAPLAQLYILAHEWGHHIQFQGGILQQIDHNSSGPTSSMVRSELQADCLAGVWIHNASGTIDSDTGVAFMKTPTNAEMRSALAAAQAVGDDRIMENAGMRANPDNFSHGSAEKRLEWLSRGIEKGTIASCDTWSVRVP